MRFLHCLWIAVDNFGSACGSASTGSFSTTPRPPFRLAIQRRRPVFHISTDPTTTRRTTAQFR